MGTGGGTFLQDMSELEFLGMNEKIMSDRPPLDKWRADELLNPDRHLWGLPAIANAAGVSIDTVRRWYDSTDAPITKPGGRYYSTRSAILNWLNAR